MSKIHESGKGEHLRLPAGFRYQHMDSTAVLFGAGTSTTGEMVSTSTANKNMAAFWTKSTATSGASRGIYWRHYIAGAGAEGEAARFFTTVAGVTAAVGGTVHGAHISASLDATGNISGQMVAVRATYGATAHASSRAIGGNAYALMVETDIGANNTVPTEHAFIAVRNTGSVNFTNLFHIPASTITRKGSACSSTNGLAIRLDGALAYIMVGT